MERKTGMNISLVACVAAALGFAGLAGAQDDRPTLEAVTDPSFVPFEMMDEESGEMIGFDMDILAEIADRSGFDYDLRTMDFNGIIPAIQTGNANVAIAGITITDEREEIVDFTDPYYDSGLRILKKSGDDSIADLDDLEGKKIGVKIGSTSHDFLTERFGDSADVTPYPGSSDMYMALMGGSVDAVFYDAPNVAYFARTRGGDKVETTGPLYEGQQYGLAFNDGSEWVDDANEALASMREDGTYAEIYKKWFGELPPEN